MTQVCKAFVTPVAMHSDSSDKSYTVVLRSPASPFPVCDCIAYAIKRNRNRKGLSGKASLVAGDCKHVDRALASTCTWMAPPNLPPIDTCPECGGPIVEFEDEIVLSATQGTSVRSRAGSMPRIVKSAEEKQEAKTVTDLESMVKDLLKGSGHV